MPREKQKDHINSMVELDLSLMQIMPKIEQ